MPSILIVEDDQFVAEMYMKNFVQVGFDVALVATGAQAVKYLETNTPDAMPLDIMLPDFDGFEVLKRIAKDGQKTPCPVVVVSNLSDGESISKATDLGVQDYMVKANVTPKEIVARVKEILKLP